jgi:hypothetical protein
VTVDEIAAIAIEIAACSPLERVSNMEARTILELMDQRGYLRRPPDGHPIATRPVTGITRSTTP